MRSFERKVHKKLIKKRSGKQTCKDDGLRVDFWLIFGRFWSPKSIKNRSKNEVEKRCETSSDKNGQGSANGRLGRPAALGVEGHGNGVGGRVNPSHKGL